VIFQATCIDCVYVIDVERNTDERGFFARASCQREFAARGLSHSFVQTSMAWTRTAGTIRGLHFQESPHGEAKLVACTHGAAYVVAVDLRSDSITQGKWVGIELSRDNRRLLYVGIGCAQGYQTLVDDTDLLYQMSAAYVPEAARGYRADDPAFAIAWPLPVALISPRDREWPDYRGSK
jgi:dTDP-4-dehydrorhamnose 3,5-epimerase